jgi:DNA (cytosine-5)-methyltransferase 1
VGLTRPPRRLSWLGESCPSVVDLLAGAGGLSLGFRQAGFRLALAVELDRNAGRTYQVNQPHTPVFNCDVVDLDTRLVQDLVGGFGLDALIAGPPCQGYSVAGLRHPHDPRNALSAEILRMAVKLRPRFVVIENVRGIIGIRAAGLLRPLLADLDGLGYAVACYLLRACDFGIPQRRERVFIIGRLEGQPPLPLRPTHCAQRHWCDCGLPPTPTVLDAIGDLPALGPGENAEHLLPNASTIRHSPRVVAKIASIPPGGGPLSYRRLRPDMAATLVAGHRALPVHPLLHRTISVREAARLQGFPDDYVFAGPRSSQPLQVANAVPPPVAKALATTLAAAILEERTDPRSVLVWRAPDRAVVAPRFPPPPHTRDQGAPSLPKAPGSWQRRSCVRDAPLTTDCGVGRGSLRAPQRAAPRPVDPHAPKSGRQPNRPLRAGGWCRHPAAGYWRASAASTSR